VIGAGAWGTALAVVAAQNGHNVTLWARESQVVQSVNTAHRNALFLPEVPLPDAITARADTGFVREADAILLVVPAQHLRASLATLAQDIKQGTPVVLCAKGIEKSSGKLVTEILQEVAPVATPAILSGPSFALDVARGLPTAVTIAAAGVLAARLQAVLGSQTFRPYASDDLIGVALGGAAKNVYAIACGVVDGLKLGESARAALLARSFAELARLGEKLGARRETLMGLSGLGDLVLTATSPTSRNFRFGRALGSGRPLAELTQPGEELAEGVETAPALVARGKRASIELPVAETVAAMLSGTLAPGAAAMRLMSRPLTSE
jgi:glycerol-3-phosphate dehydrogenase (NAD(P)+)